MYDFTQEPCCIGIVTSGGDDRCHEPDCPDRLPTIEEYGRPTAYDYAQADQDWADRWLTAWDRLEPLGIVDSSDADDMRLPLAELERLVGMLGPRQAV